MNISFIGYREKPFDCKVIFTTDSNGMAHLQPFTNEVNHSPTGFEWGYGGSGPAQLSYAILRKYFNIKHTRPEAERLAKLYYGDFKWDVVAKFPKEGFFLYQSEIESWFQERLTDSAYRSIIIGE